MANQTIMRSIVEDRLALSDGLRVHNHQPQMCLLGSVVDIGRTPDRKHEDGWSGPAEIIPIDRHTDSAIVQQRRSPLLIPFPHLRRPALESNFACIYCGDVERESNRHSSGADLSFFYHPIMANAACRAEITEGIKFDKGDAETTCECKTLMDIVDGTAYGKLVWMGLWLMDQSRNYWVPSVDVVEQCILLKHFAKISHTISPAPHGFLYRTDLR